ncbi:filamentous hemagglutinin N-terminal domain-containing protein [[Phormidium] sp. ETS-05]|uniref:two-partner secretion domain-containing protein n=1 Tax=[Phormidium] sp. ETS-05 TaxID=222819 RepID=UPI0018EEE3B7|nr:filamentous hemagglutinin N-terminal domain-containing protein [[Phormidium] sp. ETS-05]
MKASTLHTLGWFALLTLISSIPTPAAAQPITPAPDGTSTRVTPDGQRYDIDGGTLSRDGGNLFHSFQQFGLDPGQTANFISNPQIHNILGRVVGGDPSIINGLIQVTGGTSNLFLMNPAGILFGPGASLNVPADFTATTANGIGFGNGWFNAFGTSDYTNLVGTPSAFNFNMSQLGTIINEGNLTLTPASNLNLFANTVINTGTLSTPGGNINITAIPNGNTLRISQPGHILSLEIENRFVGVIRESPLQPKQTLPQLLTGGDPINHATTVEKLPDGTIRLTGSQTPIPLEPGVAVVSGNLETGDRNRVSQQNLDINPINLGQKPGFLNILGDKIALIGANIDASGTNGGGNIHIGGNYQGAGPLPNATHTYIDPNTNITANAISGGNGGQIIIWSDNTTQFHGNISATGIENGGFVEISGKQNLIFRGNVDLSAPNGNNGSLLLDPENITIVNGSGGADDSQISDNQILFGDAGTTYTISETALETTNVNAAVELQATNNITVEDLTDNSLTFQSGTGAITFTADADNDGSGAFTMNSGDSIIAPGRSVTINAASITLGSLNTNSVTGGAVTLKATGDITAGSIESKGDTQAGAINITSSAGQINFLSHIYATSSSGNGGDITIKAAGNITTHYNIWSDGAYGQTNSSATGGNITLTSGGEIDTTGGWIGSWAPGNAGSTKLTAAGDIRTGKIDSRATGNGGNGTGGSITIESTGGGIDTTSSLLDSNSASGTGGNITLQAANDITTANLQSQGGTQGGDITINSHNGHINTIGGSLESNATTGTGGNITLQAANDITTANLQSQGGTQGGDITINSHNGHINTIGGSLESNATTGTGGNITLQAANDITTANLQSQGGTQGGHITITSTSDNGTINTIGGSLSSFSNTGSGGEVQLTGGGAITTGTIQSMSGFESNSGNWWDLSNSSYLTPVGNSNGNGGKITITSRNSTINTGAGRLDSRSTGGSAGKIEITGFSNITTGNILSSAEGSAANLSSGDIIITSTTGSINTTGGSLESNATTGTGGNISLQADLDITTAKIDSHSANDDSGEIKIISNRGAINTTGGELHSHSDYGSAGDVTLKAAGNITTGHIWADGDYSQGNSSANGGDITLESTGGTIDTTAGRLTSFADGNAGNVKFTAAGNIRAGNIESYAFSNGIGGQITLQADGNITTREISSYSNNGNSGQINITSTRGTIDTTAGRLSSFASSGTAGNVTLTGRQYQVK